MRRIMSGVVVVCGDTIGAANEVLRRNPYTSSVQDRRASIGRLTPYPTSAPFQGGSLRSRGPIWPVISSRCLSAASLRFLGHHVLLESWSARAGGLLTDRTALVARPDHMRVSTFRTSERQWKEGALYTPGSRCPRSEVTEFLP